MWQVCASSGSLLIEEAKAVVNRRLSSVWTDVFAPRAVHELLFAPTCLGPPSFLAVVLAAHGSSDRRMIWVDSSPSFYPPAAGPCLERLHILRPRPIDLAWVAVECLRCKQVGAVVMVMLQRPTRVDVRRLQLAAELGGGVGILLRPDAASAGSHIYAAASRWLVSPAPGERTIQRWRIDHVHGHGRQFGPSFIVEKNRATRKQILCIHLPHWSITRRLRRHTEWHSRAVVIVRTISQRRMIIDVSAAAQKVGIKPGMTAAEARALHGNLFALTTMRPWIGARSKPWDDGSHGSRRSSRVNGTRIATIRRPRFGLDLTGCERLFGGIRHLADLIAQSLRRFCIPAGIAVAPTVGSAWAFAKTAREALTIVDATELPRAILPLLTATLRLRDEALSDLHDLGLVTVGHVLALPRESLPARFGSLLTRRLDQLTGAIAEPLIKLIYDPSITASRRFDAPIESPEQIALICEQLLQSVLTLLAQRGRGVRMLRLIFTPDRGWGRLLVKREIALSRPHRHRKTLLELIGREIERIDCEHGFVVSGSMYQAMKPSLKRNPASLKESHKSSRWSSNYCCKDCAAGWVMMRSFVHILSNPICPNAPGDQLAMMKLLRSHPHTHRRDH